MLALQDKTTGKIIGRQQIDLSEILVENYQGSFRTDYIKKRLVKEGLKELVCESCCGMTWSAEITNWETVPIPLHLDHINGVSNDNRLENLRLLCPTCHNLTSTYGGKNVGKVSNAYEKRDREPSLSQYPNFCIGCGKRIGQRYTVCRQCLDSHRVEYPEYLAPTKIDWPSIDIVLQMIQRYGMQQTTKLLGLSSPNAVRGHLKARGVTDIPRKRKEKI